MQSQIYILPCCLFLFLLLSCESASSDNNELGAIDSSSPKTEQNQTEVIVSSTSDSTEQETVVKTLNTYLEKLGLNDQIESIQIYTYEVDEAGEQIGMGGHFTEIEINQDGNISKRSVQGCCGVEGNYFIYEYNDNGQLVRLYSFFEPDAPENLDKHQFDHKEKYFYKDEKLVKTKKVNSDTTLIQEHEYDYDSDGRLTQEYIQDHINKINIEIKYAYEGNTLTKSYFENSEPDYEKVFQVNNNGDTIQEELITSKFHLIKKYFYEFDTHNNWSEKSEVSYYDSSPNNKTYLITDRTFKYY